MGGVLPDSSTISFMAMRVILRTRIAGMLALRRFGLGWSWSIPLFSYYRHLSYALPKNGTCVRPAPIARDHVAKGEPVVLTGVVRQVGAHGGELRAWKCLA